MNEVFLRMPGGGGLGDLVCFLGAAGIYAKRHPNNVTFTNVLPAVLECYDPPVLQYHDCRHVAPLDAFRGHRKKHNSPDRNYVGSFLASMGEQFAEPPAMELPSLDPMAGLEPGSYIALQPFSGFARNPERGGHFAETLVKTCLDRASHIPIICVGHPNTKREVAGVNYEYLSGPRGMLRAIQHAAMVLTPRSASAHIAAAYQIPSFLWLPDDGENWHLNYPDWTTCRVSIEAPMETIAAELRSFFDACESRALIGFSRQKKYG